MGTSQDTTSGGWNPVQLTLWSEEAPAKHFPQPDCDEDSTTHAGNSPLSICNWLRVSGLNGLSGKMSPVSCLRMGEGRLEPSSGPWRNSGMGSRTECWTLGTSEFPSGGGVSSSLRDVLEIGEVAPKFFLRPSVCQAMLHCARQRGRALLPTVQLALEQVAVGTNPPAPEP